MKALTIASLAALVMGAAVALPATGAVSVPKQVKQALRISKKADARSRETRLDQERHSARVDQRLDAQDEEVAGIRRDVQTANGRITTLPDTFNDNKTHEHADTGIVVADTKGSVSATCPDDEAVVSGGYEFDTNQGITTPQPQVVGERVVGNSWTVTLNNVGGTLPVHLDVFANCVPR